MTYEIAKKLKDAGFPIKTIPAYDNAGKNAKLVDAEFEFLAPTLSKLIEACGDRFISLNRRFDDYNKTAYWEAIGMGGKYPQIVRGINITIKGTTPKEAVANLWWELNKK